MEADIERALTEHAALLGGDIAFMNRPFDPNGEYLRVSLSFLTPDRLTLDAMHRLEGFLQIDVMTPENGGTNMGRVQQIVDHFPTDLVLTHGAAAIRIKRRAGIGPLIKTAPFWQQPVTVNWQVYT